VSTLTQAPPLDETGLIDITGLGPNEARRLILGTLDHIKVNEVLLMAPGDHPEARAAILECRRRLTAWATALYGPVT
jgi:hypothetical protein